MRALRGRLAQLTIAMRLDMVVASSIVARYGDLNVCSFGDIVIEPVGWPFFIEQFMIDMTWSFEVCESDFTKNLAAEETQEADAVAVYEKTTQDNKLAKTVKSQDVVYKTWKQVHRYLLKTRWRSTAFFEGPRGTHSNWVWPTRTIAAKNLQGNRSTSPPDATMDFLEQDLGSWRLWIGWWET